MPSGQARGTRASIAIQLALFLVAAALLLPAVTPADAVSGGAWIKLLFLARVVALVGLAHGMLRAQGRGWSDVGLRRPDGRRLVIALAAGLAMVMLVSPVARAVILSLGLPAPDYAAFAPIRGRLGEYLFWALPVTLGTAALGEELLFRGFVMDALQRLIGGSATAAIMAALVLQALIFGALHFYQGAGGMIVAGATGLALGLTWLLAGRTLWAGIILHALLDGFAMTAIYLGAVAT
ncbi:CPBP family intramembrane glutamic endopeptidase [Sphingomonas morindae]|uniref:CPBP family intramembrane metalloprotease n=1 Tax=Sphingomonas morindae TaxID=1541170 RepID=A0ABY4X7C1_9SPHN|nr:CPBP family intramembrane glutamic endopeptidase [Sphingomonas morindae]USI72802.1 CPBP family intramembrane metalloprotease [Sphingomonas morindae]